MKRRACYLAIGFIALALAACQQGGQKQTLGTLLGAVGGAVAGSQIGKGRGQLVAVAAGTLLGSFLGSEIGKSLDRADRIFKRHGGWIVLFGRLVPGVRSLISLPAGVYAMPIGRFLLLTASGSAIWSAFLAVAGYQLAENFRALEAYIGPASKLVLGLLVLAWLYHIGKHYWRRRHG